MIYFARRRHLRSLIIIIIFCLILYFACKRTGLDVSQPQFQRSGDENSYFPDSDAKITEKIDWNDHERIRLDAAREGNGEQGVPAQLPSGSNGDKQELWDTNGFNALLSDNIPLDRALTDIRHKKCVDKKYNAELPTVSVVIPFFEEHWTTLLRTVVSVVNRSPKHILKEIILVDDGSTMKDFLGSKLDSWMHSKYGGLVQIIRLPQREGLIIARQEGAKLATGDVIVVLDSHCEVMVGWLPPLLEPITEDPRTVVCPLIDVINAENFAYYPQDNGGRGGFDWRFYYKRLPLYQSDEKRLPEPFENPVMNGGLFAINRKFFWELGGYDDGLKIWGGEQYNLSFKIWLCGGRLFDAPCSRVGHVFRHGGKKRPAAKNAGNFIGKNYKRVAVAWMDEYAEALYRRNPSLRKINEGDLTKELQVKERLHCKPFKWFLENVAPDLVKTYPPVEPPDFANGTITSMADTSLCIDTGSKEQGDLILYSCHGLGPQYFSLSYRTTIKVESEQFCWSAPGQKGAAPVLEHCSNRKPSPSHSWRYDPDTMQIMEKAYNRCVQAKPSYRTLAMEPCDPNNKAQKWKFKFVDKQLIYDKLPSFS